MGLFDKFKNRGNNFETACKKMGTEFVDLYLNETNSLFENITELERQILAIYFFGMVDGLRQNLDVDSSTNEVAKTVINLFNDVFKYSEEQSEAFFDSIIGNLQSNDPQNTQYAIIHRGLNGYYAWSKNNKKDVIKDVAQIYGMLNK